MPQINRISELCATTDLGQMDKDELLAAVRTLELTYRNKIPTLTRDHRRYLSREELEVVFTLAQRLVRNRIDVPKAGKRAEKLISVPSQRC
ncbi:MAG: hypothetical protein KDB27_28270 [Planctomycetales bacterium]|nr:hypothetical protein [Planctomycetales bacterium]